MLLFLLAAPAALAQPLFLADGALVLTHATRRYQSHAEVVSATAGVVDETLARGGKVYALGDAEVATDPRWYAERGGRLAGSFLSSHGEHELVPEVREGEVFSVTLAGGYHCACLGTTLAELVARFLSETGGASLVVRLPMAAIYTGYLFDLSGRLAPATPREEANADDSVDGLSLAAVTVGLSDPEWVAFLRESLYWTLFAKAPVRDVDWERGVGLRLYREGRLLERWGPRSGRAIELRYE